MSSKTTYWCDRCRVELDVEALQMLSVETENVATAARKRQHLELCEPCAAEVLAVLDATLTMFQVGGAA